MAMAATVLDQVLTSFGVPVGTHRHAFTGEDPLVRSPHRLATAAAVAIAAHAVTAANLFAARGGGEQEVAVDLQDALRVLHSGEFLRRDGNPWGHRSTIESTGTGFYQTRDGRWLMLVVTYPHLREHTARLLGCSADREGFTKAIIRRDGLTLETELAEAGVCAAMARTRAQWRESEPGRLLATRPLVELTKIAEAPTRPLAPAPRPASGIRVLDFTHVIAGPIAARGLAEHGADVLHVTRPVEEDPENFVADTGRGKRNAHLDLSTPAAAARFRELARQTDVFVQSWRPGAVAALGYGPEQFAALNPGGIMVEVSCYGHDGPFSRRKGFDQMAQAVTGVAVEEGSIEAPRLVPTYLFNDYVLGYLAAAGAMEALRRRADEGGSWLVRLNLARASMWLQDLGSIAATEYATAAQADPVAGARLETVQSGFGVLEQLPLAARLSKTPPHFDLPTTALGTAEPVWLPR